MPPLPPPAVPRHGLAGHAHAPRLLALGCAVAFLALTLGFAPTRAEGSEASEVFQRYADLVIGIEVAETQSGAKANLGSGFAVALPNRAITNFHVVSKAVLDPERYHATAIDAAGERFPLRILAVDVIGDLALVESERLFTAALVPRTEPIAKGVRIFSLGNPLDLGFSIVEGNYNGLAEHGLNERIHFSGSLNPGMSGGPTLDAEGAVVGVNVATAGQHVSFLVPASGVAALLDQARDGEATNALRDAIRAQLLAFQQRYLDAISTSPREIVTLGRYRVLTQPAPFLNCWGEATHEDNDLYEARIHRCSSDDSIFLSARQYFSVFRLSYQALHSDRLTPSRFYALYSRNFAGEYTHLQSSEEDLTPFRCRERFVRNAELLFKTVFCARRYRHYEGLYDVVFRAAALGQPDAGLETSLVFAATSLEAAEQISRRHLEAIGWNG